MGVFSNKARKAGEDARRMKMAARKKLAAKFGGATGDYFPSRIRSTMLERKVPIADIPAFLVVGAKEMKSETLPLDHPIFNKPEKKEKRPYRVGKGTGDNREVVLRLLTLIERLI